MTIGPGHYALLAGIVFSIGVFGLLSRRDVLGLLASLAVMMLAPVIAFAGFAEVGGGPGAPAQGEVVALAVVGVTAAQVAVGAGLVALLRRRRDSLDVDDYDELEA